MGLLQVPSSETSEEVEAASLGAFLQSPPRFTNVSTCDMHGMHSESMSPFAGNPLCSSMRESQRNTCLELSKVGDDSFKFRGAIEVTSNINGMKIGSVDKGVRFTPKSGRNIQNPVSRVVGFESGGTSSLTDGFKGVSAVHAHSSTGNNVTVNETESGGSLVRKRLSSPLSSMLSPCQFGGDPLDIGSRNMQANAPAVTDNFRISVAKDNKKANVGSQNHFRRTYHMIMVERNPFYSLMALCWKTRWGDITSGNHVRSGLKVGRYLYLPIRSAHLHFLCHLLVQSFLKE